MSMNMIQVGLVSAVDSSKQRVRVTFPDRENQVSNWLQVVTPFLKYGDTTQIELPNIGDTALCLFLGNGIETGYCIGKVGAG